MCCIHVSIYIVYMQEGIQAPVHLPLLASVLVQASTYRHSYPAVISKFDTPSGAELNFTSCLPPGRGRCCTCISLYVNIIWEIYLSKVGGRLHYLIRFLQSPKASEVLLIRGLCLWTLDSFYSDICH